MFTNNIAQLEERGFTVTRHPDLRTQVTHKKSFVIESSGKNVSAFFLESDKLYSIMLSGYPINGQLQENIQQLSMPLMQTINAVNNPAVPDAGDEPAVNVIDTEFGKLEIGSMFFKEHGGFEYKKITESTCMKQHSKIGGSLELPILPSVGVFITEMADQMISMEQKQNIIDNLPRGLQKDEFEEAVYMDFENIPGFETVGDETMLMLCHELWAMYTS